MKTKYLFAAAFIMLSESLLAGVPFENPVFREDAPDPTIWTAPDGTYRATSTAKEILKST